jgi:predicted phage terminase large subunit-like protein
MRFICASYSGALALESAEMSRELVRSASFQSIYPELDIKEDKDQKSNFRIVHREYDKETRTTRMIPGGSRYSTSVGGTLTGFHGDILIVDDPLNPTQATSDVLLATANHWIEQTLSTRKTDKAITPTVLIMQRLHQNDPSGHWLAKNKLNTRHICLPGEIRNYRKQLCPPDLAMRYVDELLDPVRMPWTVLQDMQEDLGQYGYAGQIGQNPTPPGGGMFKVDRLTVITEAPSKAHVVKTVRYWDKAGTQDAGAYTAGVKISLLMSGKWVVEDVKRGRWGTDQRESIIRNVAEADGNGVHVWVEQEPGSGGKESAEGTIRNLGGYSAYAERPTGDKVFRADPFSVQVNNGNVMLLTGSWHRDFIEELRFFPYSTYKDQTDAASGAFSHLTQKKFAQRIT